MSSYEARGAADGLFYNHDGCGRRIAGPYPDKHSAERHAAELESDRWLLVVVERAERSRSVWDSYIKMFRHADDGRSAQERLLDWWLELPDHSYTRTRALVRVFDITGREQRLLAPGDARSVLPRENREFARSTMGIVDAVIDGSSADHVVDEHELSEEELTDAAIELLVGDGHLQALLDELQPRITERALANRKERS